MSACLLVFAKPPLAGHVKTRLVPGLQSGEAADLYRAFIRDTDAMASAVGESVRWYVAPAPVQGAFPPVGGSVHTQVGDSLGARLEHAFRESVRAGFERVVVIGTDSPTVPAGLVRQAFAALTRGQRAVIGPAADGGYFLLGLRDVEPDFFTGIQYSSPDVFRETIDAISAKTGEDAVILDQWYDVDTLEDLRRLAMELGASPELAPHSAQALNRLGLLDNGPSQAIPQI